MIFYDNIINYINAGNGISRLFNDIQDGLIKNNINFKILDDAKEKNYYFKRYLSFDMKDLTRKDIFHSTYYRLSKKSINVTTVHDFTYEKKIGGLKTLMHHAQKKNALRNSNKIICISNSTKNDMYELMPFTLQKNVQVIYNSVGKEYKFLSSYDHDDHILYVGSRADYKNFNTLVKFLGALKDFRLKIVGGGALKSDEIELLNKLVPNRYSHLKNISNESLNLLYNKSYCLAYLSEYEGFGLPVLEAMNAGCPVIAFDNPAVREISDGKIKLIESLDLDEFKNCLHSISNNKNRKLMINAGIERASFFSRESAIASYISAYKELDQ